MNTTFRCNCPFTSALDVLGDKWILVIVKQMLIEGKETFKDFTESEEAIATNILSTKLKWLEQFGLVTKKKLSSNKRVNLYHLTESGLALAPVLVELANWSDQNLREFHPGIKEGDGMNFLRSDKAGFTQTLVTNYRDKLTENTR